MRGRRGHALMELVIALPVLSIGGAAIAGILIASSGFVLEGERRLEAALRGSELLDSLRVEAPGRPAEGTFEALDRPVAWSWDGAGTLQLSGIVTGPAGERPHGVWTLETRP